MTAPESYRLTVERNLRSSVAQAYLLGGHGALQEARKRFHQHLGYVCIEVYKDVVARPLPPFTRENVRHLLQRAFLETLGDI